MTKFISHFAFIGYMVQRSPFSSGPNLALSRDEKLRRELNELIGRMGNSGIYHMQAGCPLKR